MTPRRAATAIALLAPILALWQAGAFDLEGHRGARGLRPENTLAAFSHAMAIGVTTLEMDLAVTKDSVLVISHDPFLNPDLVRGPTVDDAEDMGRLIDLGVDGLITDYLDRARKVMAAKGLPVP